MKIIGLCGGSGSGKGSVAKMFLNFNIPGVDADCVYHELTDKPSECLSELCSEFGNEILNTEGGLDRAALGKIVFYGDGAEERRKRLNAISHKHVLMKIREIISEYKEKDYPAVIVDAPLLFESGFNTECDLIILVVAERETRIRRIVERDGVTPSLAEKRIDTQIPDEELKSRVDYVIDNSGALAKTYGQVTKITKELLKR